MSHAHMLSTVDDFLVMLMLVTFAGELCCMVTVSASALGVELTLEYQQPSLSLAMTPALSALSFWWLDFQK